MDDHKLMESLLAGLDLAFNGSKSSVYTAAPEQVYPPPSPGLSIWQQLCIAGIRLWSDSTWPSSCISQTLSSSRYLSQVHLCWFWCVTDLGLIWVSSGPQKLWFRACIKFWLLVCPYQALNPNRTTIWAITSPHNNCSRRRERER